MAVRTDATTDYLRRTANLPSSTTYTACGWALSPALVSDQQVFVQEQSGTGAGNFLAFNSSDGSLRVHNGSTFGVPVFSVVAGEAFFWAVSQAGTGATDLVYYARARTSNVLLSQTHQGASFTNNMLTVGSSSFDEGSNLRVWNVKVWNRIVTPAELLVESFYRRLMFPASINFHWHADRHDQVFDISGNGRNPTIGGTLTTEDGSYGLWQSRRRVFIPAGAAVAFDAAFMAAMSVQAVAPVSSLKVVASGMTPPDRITP